MTSSHATLLQQHVAGMQLQQGTVIAMKPLLHLAAAHVSQLQQCIKHQRLLQWLVQMVVKIW